MENPLGIKSLKESMHLPVGTVIRNYCKSILTCDWVFGSWVEKIILLLMFLWSGYSLIKLLIGF